MSGGLEPNDEGTVCCVCRRAIVPNLDAVHAAYHGREARHWECTSKPNMEKAFSDFDAAYQRGMRAIDELRRKVRD